MNRRVTQPQYGGGSHGIRYESGLYSAAARPWGSYFGVETFPSPYGKSAALMEGIIRNHPFVDGNKRTAFIVGVQLLQKLLPGKEVRSTPQDEVEVTSAVERRRMDTADLAAWFEEHSN